MTALRGILAKNGFGAAAANLRLGDMRNVEDTMRMWEGYPRIMDERYPMRLAQRTDRGLRKAVS